MPAINSRGSTGLETCIWNPASNARWRSSARAYAVNAIAGRLRISLVHRTDLADQLVAIEVGHADVADEDVHVLLREDGPRLPRRSRPRRATAAVFLDEPADEDARVGLVVDHQCAATPSRLGSSMVLTSHVAERRPFGAPSVLRAQHRDRQGNDERRALAFARALPRTVPPCSSTRCFTIDSPSPRPPWRRVVDASACRKRSKT